MPSQTPAQRRAAATEAAKRMRQEQQAAARRRRMIGFGVLGVAVLALIGVAAVVIGQNWKQTSYEDIALADVATVPSVALEDGGIPVSAQGVGVLDESVPRVDIYQDFICPGCGTFEQLNGAMLDELVTAGEATVVYHPLATLDSMSLGKQFSTRAAASAALVAQEDSEHYLAYTEALFANQPAENTAGLTDEEMAELARGAGVSDTVADKIAAGTAQETYGQWVYSATQLAVSDSSLVSESNGGFVTPTVTIDGAMWEGGYDTETLRAGILGEG
ncbi:thioredoxin domain-containing protein [Cellulomonas sp. NPDC089187]|uniref:DsbA family protein n=1 Tax=Cellulomonas sp. NPDC089187 TaxID=3154970 RepID=UPI0034462A02